MIDVQKECLYNVMTFYLKSTDRCYKTKLFKLLYHADFEHFQRFGQSITGLQYYAWPKGPVPRDLNNRISKPDPEFLERFSIRNAADENKIILVPKKPFNRDFVTDVQMEMLKKIAFIFEEAGADTMIESTHLRNHPWDTTRKTKGMQKKIDYELVLKDGHPEEFSKAEYDEILQHKAALKQIA